MRAAQNCILLVFAHEDDLVEAMREQLGPRYPDLIIRTPDRTTIVREHVDADLTIGSRCRREHADVVAHFEAAACTRIALVSESGSLPPHHVEIDA